MKTVCAITLRKPNICINAAVSIGLMINPVKTAILAKKSLAFRLSMWYEVSKS